MQSPDHPGPRERSTPGALRVAAGILTIIVLAGLVYLPAVNGRFLWDDEDVVVSNFALRTFDGFLRIWSKPEASPQGYYWPVTYSVFWIEYQLWGLDTLGYHLVNVALHAFNALLLWALLRRLRVPGAWVAAALFAVHPVQVESVAWIVELKNTLSTALVLSSLLVYFGPAPGERVRNAMRVTFSLGLFIAALLSKSSTAALPLIMVFLHMWRGDRFTVRLCLRLALFFLFAAVVGSFQAHVYQQGHTILHALPWANRILLASTAWWFYVGKVLWPVRLMAIYPRWPIEPGQPLMYLYPLAIIAVFAAAFLLRRRIGRGPFTALACFTAGLLSVLHLLPQGGFTSVTYANDHALYLPSMAFAAAAGALYAAARRRVGPALGIVPAALLLVFSGLSFRHAHLFTDRETLFTHAIANNPDAWPAYGNLAEICIARGQFDKAEQYYEQLLALNPTSHDAFNGLGVIAANRGDLEGAAGQFRKALALVPNNLMTLNNLALALKESGRPGEAVPYLERALEINPHLPLTHFNVGLVRAALEEWDKAQRAFARTVELDPRHAGAWHNLGSIYKWQEQTGLAADAFTRVLEIQPGNARAMYDLAETFILTGRRDQALTALDQARHLARGQSQLLEQIEILEKALNAAQRNPQPLIDAD
ncbi:MAG: tetratricopeptide repeat protein [Kiritimatiellae bacterium]|nr:tetratricopeptide repeat protein [Kiritimatiellia bacterium]